MVYKILIIGLGNPILGDDGVGWKVTDSINTILKDKSLYSSNIDIEIDNIAVGGLGLMERLVGYNHVILVDAIQTSKAPIGHVGLYNLDDLYKITSTHTASAHDMSLPTAINLGQQMGFAIPANIDIIGIETLATYDFSEALSPPINQAIPVAVNLIYKILQKLE